MPHQGVSAADSPIGGELPILAVQSTVLFPSAVISLQAGASRHVALLQAVREDQDIIALFAQRPDSAGDTLAMGDLAPIGVAARIVRRLKLGGDRLQVLLHGLARVQLLELTRIDPFPVGRVQPVPAMPAESAPRLDVLMGHALDAYERLVRLDNRYSPEPIELLRMNIGAGPDLFSDLLATYLNAALAEKQHLVETLDPGDRLGRLVDLIEREIARIMIENDVSLQATLDIKRKQREHLLREQIRIIQDELGEGASRKEGEKYLEEVDRLPLDDGFKETIRRECRRLASLSEQSAEHAVLRTYLETIFSLPWTKRTPDSLDIEKVERLLTRHHYGLGEIKERILDYLAVARLKGTLAGPILCLAGPPGTGKTSLARSIAEALGREFARISLGGVGDESEIRGHRRTYVAAMPGRFISAYARVGSRNPLILIDEVDKLGKDMRGDPAAALLEILDPEQNRSFIDHYLGLPFDLSDTLFIATANLLDTIPPALRDRFEVLTLAGYTEADKLKIARRYILPKALEAHGLARASLRFSGQALLAIIRNYTAEAGVRELERKLATICRKIARRRAAETGRRTARSAGRPDDMGERDVKRLLGPALFTHEFAERNPEIGLATGLAWTAAGGEILFIEATRMIGTGKVEITGHLGEVMRESVQAAFSYVRSRATELEIQPDVFKTSDIHIHFPAGATPKDGPSAGVAVATCLASLLSEHPVRHDVAMTGEISLRGKVLSVGGIKDKVLAAHRATIKTVVLPEGNRKDLPQIPDKVRKDLRIVFAQRVEDVWREALTPILVPKRGEAARRFDTREYMIEQAGSRPQGKVHIHAGGADPT
jgi:ATP-dependent Lon protease